MSSRPKRVTRLAPSPTGALHLGNARTFLINWALARQNDWHILLRIDDLDGPRIKPEAAQQAIDLLRWLGMDWDEGPVYQSHELGVYQDALARLDERGLIYPCTCTRKEIESAQSAPHEDSHELRYPGTCRERDRQEVPDEGRAWRVRVPDEPVEFADVLAGERAVNVQQQVGDFLVATKQNLPAYQLAVVVDDARQQVSEVVRGNDLLDSTARQLLLHGMLDLGEPPRYTHLPLVLGPDGRRLAKRHGDTRLLRYRQQNVPAARVIGLLAHWSGIVDAPEPLTAGQFVERFELGRLPREPITFTTADEGWLMQAE